MSDSVQQSRKFQFRDGFPVSSSDVNDIFDSLLYDLFSILSTEEPEDNQKLKLLIAAINDIDATLHNRKDKSVMDTKDNHLIGEQYNGI